METGAWGFPTPNLSPVPLVVGSHLAKFEVLLTFTKQSLRFKDVTDFVPSANVRMQPKEPDGGGLTKWVPAGTGRKVEGHIVFFLGCLGRDTSKG